MLILQLRPERTVADDEYARILRYGGLEPGEACRVRIGRRGIPEGLRPEDFSAIIVGGSPFDLSTPEARKGALQRRIEADFQRLLAQVVGRDLPFLGACSGNGLLGRYLGTPVSTRYGEPVGCVTLQVTEAGRRDPLLQGLPRRIEVLLGHKEAVDALPPGATLLMTGSHCPVQMFRVGDNVYATQFHPEADPEAFALRIDTYRNHGYFPPHEAAALKRRLRGKATPHAQEILRRFVARYCR